MSDLRRFLRQDAPPDAEVFVAPSAEARRLVRHLGPLVAPKPGQPTGLAHALGFAVVAPFTQLTFVSWELQVFLFEVFHRRLAARIGHFAFMVAFNFWVMVGLASWRVEPAPEGLALLAPNGAAAYGLVLLAWYAIVARASRLPGWWFATVPLVVGLVVGATALASTVAAGWPSWAPWAGAIVSALLVAASHGPEPTQPPRVLDAPTWQPVTAYIFGRPGARHGLGTVVRRMGRMSAYLVLGTLNEAWASPRLMPYNLLAVMFRLGYAPTQWSRVRGWVDRALASGNPALDYVGTGGGTWLRDPDAL